MAQDVRELPPWESLLKRILWQQLGDIRGKRVLDFGSGLGVTASHLAEYNQVIAMEPSEESINKSWRDFPYEQIRGSLEELRRFEEESFDVILCHNVLEYAIEREDIVKELSRLLKPEGILSVVKHNRPGRVMQMVVLLNDFDHAHSLLDGEDGVASQFGTIHYYEDEDLVKWCPELRIERTLGVRTFWDMQQNQEIHKDKDWQKKMIRIEQRVSEIEEYRRIAFFHHILLSKGAEK